MAARLWGAIAIVGLAAHPPALADGPPVLQSIPPAQVAPIVGSHVTGPDGSEIGRLWDVLVGADGQPRAAVLDYGGFLGMGNRKIAVPWQSLRFAVGKSEHPVTVELTKQQLGAIPDYRSAAEPITMGAAAPVPAQ